MRGEIICIGTELLLGQIVNANAAYLSEQLNAAGIPIFYHSVVGDNAHRLEAQLHISAERADVIVLTGGLGPTQDDLTKEVVAHFLKRKLHMDEDALLHIEHFFQQRQVSMPPNNRKQAEVLEGAHVFPNDHGLAPGMAIQDEQHHYLLFPGPPNELKPMFQTYALPYLRSIQVQEQTVYSKVMRFCGIGESLLEDRLQHLFNEQTDPTIAPLAGDGEVSLRITSLAHSKDEAERKMQAVIRHIHNKIGMYQFGWDDDQLQSVCVSRLQEHNLTVATAESCTGGLLSHLLSSVNGASNVFVGGLVCYTNQIKKQLGLDAKVMKEHGVVSEVAAESLALLIRERMHADVGISITGVAGPTEQEGKPVGLVYIGIALPTQTLVKTLRLTGDRSMIQQKVAKLALFYLWQALDHPNT